LFFFAQIIKNIEFYKNKKSWVSTWKDFYGYDPVGEAIKAGADAADAARLIIGGELADWAESVDQVDSEICIVFVSLDE